MKRMILVALAASVLLGAGGLAVGMVIGARNPTKRLAEARKRNDELEDDLKKARDKANERIANLTNHIASLNEVISSGDARIAELERQQDANILELKKAQDRIAELERQREGQNADVLALKKAQERIAELERELAAAERAATTNGVGSVIALNGKDGGDIIDSLKSKLSKDEFSQVTNAMTQLRARLAEKAKGRMEYLASINTDGMSDDERANHAKFLKLMERREAIAAKMKGGFPDTESLQQMVQLEMEMAPVAKKARSALAGQVARELGYQGDDVEVVRDTVNMIYDCTSGGGMGGLGDIMESAGGAPGMSVSPEVKVETHVIGL